MIGFGVIGYGYWGPNWVRNLVEMAGARVVGTCDLRKERLALIQARYPTIHTTTDYRELLKNPAIDAVVIATPVQSHFDLALQALRANKHVLVEKPLTATVEQSMILIEEAARRRLVLMVDHTFVYTDAVRTMRRLVEQGLLGNIYYYDSVRVNLGLFQHDVNVLWDLAVHDLSIMEYVLGIQPSAIAATGVAHVAGQPEDIAYLTCYFEQNVIAHFHVNWLAPVKVRRTLIGGDRQMIVYDDLEPSEKVKVYDKGITLNGGAEGIYQLLVGYRAGDMWAPKLSTTEALSTEARHFVDCIHNGTQPITDGVAGLRVVSMLEIATRSMAQRGQSVEICLERACV
ncbi:MAG: Gfo/Idh/MocA family oxidoreductase [Chloroflexales bacterium]|nr:Gfo/Idh/MocA family oxidoreductase [Chloroflexales bacterium]